MNAPTSRLRALLSGQATGQTWRASALCAQVDPELFFPEKGAPNSPAKAICRRCPVQAECLDDAVTSNRRYGIWGGLSESQRRRLTPTELEEAA